MRRQRWIRRCLSPTQSVDAGEDGPTDPFANEVELGVDTGIPAVIVLAHRSSHAVSLFRPAAT